MNARSIHSKHKTLSNFISSLLICTLVALASSCLQKNSQMPHTTSTANIYSDTPITICIHGTMIPPGISLFVRMFDIPLGLTPATEIGKTYIHGRIAYILHKSNSQLFPLETSYFFGWTGSLSFAARQKTALQLYKEIKKLKSNNITLIGHSHGGNIALNLAYIARKYNDTELQIRNLVLLATPALAATKHLAQDPIFQHVYSLYSLGDYVQVGDPQGLYTQLDTASSPQPNGPVPLFSQRLFGPGPRIHERRILYKNRNIGHMDFITQAFIERLADIVRFLDINDTEVIQDEAAHMENQKKCMLNIPANVHEGIEQILR